MEVFQQSIQINARVENVERCLTDRVLMHRWLNPMLACEPIGDWSTELGARSRFIIKIPLLQPTLESVVMERKPGLIIWQFEGFFQGRDRWECQEKDNGTILLNRFEFTIPNAIVKWGFNLFAATLTKRDMEAQLQRLKLVAEGTADERR